MRFSPYDTVAVIKGRFVPDTAIQICNKTFQGFLFNTFSQHSIVLNLNPNFNIDSYKTIYLTRIPGDKKTIKKIYAKKQNLTLHLVRIVLIEKV